MPVFYVGPRARGIKFHKIALVQSLHDVTVTAKQHVSTPDLAGLPTPGPTLTAERPLTMSSAARLCEEYSACFCSSSVQPAAFRRGLDASAAYMAEAEQLRALIGRVQSSACGRGLRRFRVPLLGYGLGGSFYDHLRRLLPIWQAFIERPAHEVPPGIAVPAYAHFAANRGNDDAYLWATFDDTLPCESWYGCYWEPLARPCADADVQASHNFTALYMGTHFERRWGSTLFSAALLHAWWRPTSALQEQLDQAVRRVFHDVTTANSAPPAVTTALRCLALHVRRGDACPTSWRHCPPIEEYLAAATELSRRFSLTSIFVATDDAEVLDQLNRAHAERAQQADPHGHSWTHVLWQQYDRAPFNQSHRPKSGTRFWVEQRLRWSRHSERPLGGKPVLQFLVDIEAASHCQALVGTMDSHASRLILLRMASRLGAVPPFYSLVAPSCPMTTLPKQTERFCLNHTLAKSAGVNDGESSVCPGLVTPEYR